MPNQPTLEDLINLTFEKCELISEKDEINSANDGKEIKPMPNQSDQTKKHKLKMRKHILLDEVLHWEVHPIISTTKDVKRKGLYDIFKDTETKNKIMPNQSDMQAIITLTKEQFDLFKSMGQIIDNEYFNLPQYFKCIGDGNFEVLTFEQLPDYVKEDLKDIIPNPLQKELDITDQLLEDFQKVIKAIPECPDHGDLCIPHALEWIEEKKNTYSL